MKKVFFLSIIGLLFSITFCGQESMKPDFRKVRWGMSRAQVKEIEKTEVMGEKGEETVVYEVNEEILGMSCYLGYLFNKDRLYRCTYMFIHKHSNKTDFIDDFKKLKKALICKYGKPKSDKKYWKNDLYKKNPQEWGFAISLGHLFYLTEWENDRSKLFIQLSGDNYKIKFNFFIESKVIKIEEESTAVKF